MAQTWINYKMSLINKGRKQSQQLKLKKSITIKQYYNRKKLKLQEGGDDLLHRPKI